MAKDYSKIQGVVAVGSSVFNEVSSVASSVAQDVVETGGSLWQSVIDTAADSLASGREAVVDAGEAAYEALPEMDEAEEAARAFNKGVVDTATSVAGKASTLFKAVTSPVGMNFLNDIVFGDNLNTGMSKLGITKGADVLSEEGQAFIKNLVIDKGILDKGSITVGKEVYEELEGGISVNQTGGSSASTIVNKLAEGNPASEARLILGRFKAYIDDNNDIIVEDQFNYNAFINPIDGVEYTPEEYEKALEDGKFTQLEVLASVFKNGEPNYAMARQLGFLLGSKDYKDDSRDEGRSFKINLGKAE